MAPKPAGALEVGRRVFLCAPSARHRDEFLALMKESRAALHPWVARYLKILGRWRDHERWAITAEACRR